MKRIAAFAAVHSHLAWLFCLLLAVLGGLLAEQLVRDLREQRQLQQLETAAQRGGIELMAQTLNSNLIGAVAMMGLTDHAIKQEARAGLGLGSPELTALFESVGRALDADGVFLVSESGLIASSWDNSGRPSTGLDVRFRPYFQMAMQGMANVYAAVSIARGDRALYFAAPVYFDSSNGSEPIGAMVARVGMVKLDNDLRDRADVALLLSPQGVVFASTRQEWIARLAGEISPERLQAIRELKQFGKQFEHQQPVVLPLAVTPGMQVIDGRRYAVALAAVPWNDPQGDWHLLLMDDMGRTIPLRDRLGVAILAGALILLAGILLLKLLQSQHARIQAAEKLRVYAKEQELATERKAQLAALTMNLQKAGNISGLVATFFREVHQQLGVLQGVIYLQVQECGEQFLRLAGSFACDPLPESRLALGEGLLGQCARERREMLLDSQDAFVLIRSGLGENPAAALLITPLMRNDSLLGVLEVALLHVPDAQFQEHFRQLAAVLALNLQLASASSPAQRESES